MNKFLVLLAFSMLSLCVASASPIPCTLNMDFAVSSSTVITCGGLTFDNFQVLHATGGAAGTVDILSGVVDPATGEIDLTFNPNLGASQDEQLLFAVWGGISQIDMSVAGNLASVLTWPKAPQRIACRSGGLFKKCPPTPAARKLKTQPKSRRRPWFHNLQELERERARFEHDGPVLGFACWSPGVVTEPPHRAVVVMAVRGANVKVFISRYAV